MRTRPIAYLSFFGLGIHVDLGISVTTLAIRCFEMGTAQDTRKVVGYASEKYWELAQMNKGEAYKILKTSTTDEIQLWGVK